MISRIQKIYNAEDIHKIAQSFHAWQDKEDYEDIPGFCKSAKLDEVRQHDYALTPGRYVGVADIKTDEMPFAEKMELLNARLKDQFSESARIEEQIRENLEGLGYEC